MPCKNIRHLGRCLDDEQQDGINIWYFSLTCSLLMAEGPEVKELSLLFKSQCYKYPPSDQKGREKKR